MGTPVASRVLRRRAERGRALVSPGCPACRGWPAVWLVGVGDPEPPTACEHCGRRSSALACVDVRVRLADV